MEPLLYKISTAMSMLQVSRATIYRMIGRGELELVKISLRASRITASSVMRVAGATPGASSSEINER